MLGVIVLSGGGLSVSLDLECGVNKLGMSGPLDEFSYQVFAIKLILFHTFCLVLFKRITIQK